MPHSERRLDVVYRAKQLPYWFGSHGQLKHRIAEAVQERAGALGLSTDISTRPDDTVYGDGWLDFLISGRAVIGAESGSSVLDERGEIQRRISRLLAEQPRLTFDEVDAQMPAVGLVRLLRDQPAPSRGRDHEDGAGARGGPVQRRARAGAALHPGAP